MLLISFPIFVGIRIAAQLLTFAIMQYARKKMGVTPLAGNQPGKGMMALLGAQEGARDPKPTIKGEDGNNGNVSECGSTGSKRRIWSQLVFFGWFRPLSGSFSVAPVSAIFWAWMAPSAQIDPQIQRIDSTLFIKKKMGVTPLPDNRAGKGMMALLGA